MGKKILRQGEKVFGQGFQHRITAFLISKSYLLSYIILQSTDTQDSPLVHYYTRLNDWLAYISEKGMWNMRITLYTAFSFSKYI